jgi:hypothetical protein
VTEERSRRAGEIVGSCVEITMRAPRWRCRRIVESKVPVSVFASAEAFIYFQGEAILAINSRDKGCSNIAYLVRLI